MGTVFQKGASNEDDSFREVLYARRQFGGIQVGLANTAGGDLDWRVEGAAGPDDTSEVPDWSTAVAVATGAALSADACATVDIAEASCVHSHYRIAVGAAASGTPGDYVVWTQDEQA